MDSDEIVPDAGPVVEENLDEKYLICALHAIP